MNVFKFTNKSMGSVVPRLRNFKLVDSREKRFSFSCFENMLHSFRLNHVIPAFYCLVLSSAVTLTTMVMRILRLRWVRPLPMLRGFKSTFFDFSILINFKDQFWSVWRINWILKTVPIGIKNLAFTGPLQIELKDLCGKVSVQPLEHHNSLWLHFHLNF